MSNYWVIFDIDGTLADITHRLHHIKGEKKDWDAFNQAMCDDELKFDIYMLYELCCRQYKIAIVTGRFEKYRIETEHWLRQHDIHFEELQMRKDGDYRHDFEIKQEILDNHFKAKDRIIRFVVDDRDQVVEMWRRNEITCLQVQKGDY